MRTLIVLTLFTGIAAKADLRPLANFARPVDQSGLHISSPALPNMPWTVAGERGALLGRQSGRFEAWQWPLKLLSNFRIRAELADYPVPIDVNELAATVDVTPAETVLTYSHAAFTVKQHMFAVRGAEASSISSAVFFEIHSARTLELAFSFTPEMQAMWPAPNHGRPSGEWVSQEGFYILHTDDASVSAFVGMPHTRPGIQVPYQEHPQTYPFELKLSFDPKKDEGSVFPLVFGASDVASAAKNIERAMAEVPRLYQATQRYYDHFFDHRLNVHTPDQKLDQALRWAEIAIDQAQVKFHDETGLVAGYYESADSARPGYAWFFGRDTLWTTYAINAYGDFDLSRRALDFLFKRQRNDGKVMHEYSQSAESLDWKQTPYFYASADSTPLLIMAMNDYAKTSGDLSYLKAHWSGIQNAYHFIRSHTEDNGIYSNSEGTGWVESWPGGMPRQEIYLAALDQQAASAMANLAALAGEKSLSALALRKAAEIAARIESEFYSQPDKFYVFSRNAAGKFDGTASIYPAVAWWDGTYNLQKPVAMFSRWASAEFSADWGTRDISADTSFYDPISYHQGSIWPLFTGWVSLSEYRFGRTLSAYAHLMQNANLTWSQDLGSVTELLSGQFFQPLGRSSSHQLWSSAMILSPALRGLFGLDWKLPGSLSVNPHLPAEWDYAKLQNVPLGSKRVDINYHRMKNGWRIQVTGQPDRLLPLEPVEIALPATLPSLGSETRQLKVVDQKTSSNTAAFTFAGWGGTSYDLKLRVNRSNVTAEGASLAGETLHLQFPIGSGYQTQIVTFHF
jgi:glycogen debranching enzyme